jgi:hypothetical protein
MLVELQNGVLVIDTTQLLTQGLYLLIISEPPDAHAPHILANDCSDEVQALA